MTPMHPERLIERLRRPFVAATVPESEEEGTLYGEALAAEARGELRAWREEHSEELGELGRKITLKLLVDLGGTDGLAIPEIRAYELVLNRQLAGLGKKFPVPWRNRMENDLVLLRSRGYAEHHRGRVRATKLGAQAVANHFLREIVGWTGLDDFSVLCDVPSSNAPQDQQLQSSQEAV